MDEDKIPHALSLQERSRLSMTGVSEVLSFDDSSVILRTSLGVLNVHGRELQLKSLSLEGGQVAVEGSIAALIYEEPQPAGGLLRRLFK